MPPIAPGVVCACAPSQGHFANLTRSYESLPPNFSLLQNMAAGAFAGIAVRLRLAAVCLEHGEADRHDRNTPSCIPLMQSRSVCQSPPRTDHELY
jgi:hypothetical protein